MAARRKGSFELVFEGLVSFFFVFWKRAKGEVSRWHRSQGRRGHIRLAMCWGHEAAQIGSVTGPKPGSRGPCALSGFGVAAGLEYLRANSCVSVLPPTCSFLSALPLSSQVPRLETEDLPWSPVTKNWSVFV